MTKKLSELRDREWNKRCDLKYDIGSLDDIARAEFNAGFDAAVATLWPVIQNMLKALDEIATHDIAYKLAKSCLSRVETKLGIEGEK